MELSKVLELLKNALNEVPHLRELPCDNDDYPLWRDKVIDILKAAFSQDSDEYKRFVYVTSWGGLRCEDFYLHNLRQYEMALKSIIQKYELLGLEAELAAVAEPPSSIAETPNYLFDRMQFHPRLVEASKSLFETGHYAQAIFEAFKAVNNFLKEKTVLSLDGKALMSKVFNENAPIIRLNELLSQSDRDEQEGFKFLFMGAMVGIRNPKAHDNVVQTDPYRTLEYLGFASLLMKRVEEGKVAPLQKDV